MALHCRLGVLHKGKNYHLFWVNPVPAKRELYIQLVYSRALRKTGVPMYANGAYPVVTGMWDHVSFHADGRVHVRGKEGIAGKCYSNHHRLPHSIYDYEDATVLPLLFMTYQIGLENCILQLNTDKPSDINLSIAKPGLFSVLVLLARHNNFREFHQQYLKQRLNFRCDPICVDMGNQRDVLLVIPTGRLPRELFDGRLSIPRALNLGGSMVPVASLGLLPPWRFLETDLI